MTEKIGAGGHGSVFSARDNLLNQECAIKVMKNVKENHNKYWREVKLMRQVQTFTKTKILEDNFIFETTENCCKGNGLGIPNLIKHMRDDEYIYIVMDILG